MIPAEILGINLRMNRLIPNRYFLTDAISHPGAVWDPETVKPIWLRGPQAFLRE